MFSNCIIFGAGDLYIKDIAVPSDTMVIAADGGIYHTKKLGIRPDVILGDFDSSDIKEHTKDAIVFPAEKDYTDMFLAIEHGYNAGIRTFHIYGALGGKRIDHTIANLQILEHFAKLNCEIFLYGENQIITAISAINDKGATVQFDSSLSGYISLFAVGSKVTGLTINGLKYTLYDYTLTTDFPICISNEFCGFESTIKFSSGTLLIVIQSQNFKLNNFTKGEKIK